MGQQKAYNYEGSVPVVAVTIVMSLNNAFSKQLMIYLANLWTVSHFSMFAIGEL